MDGLVFLLIPIGLGATAIILGLGIYSLAKGGDFAKDKGNRLMRLRVMAQAVTIGIMLIFLIIIGKGPS
ncbi:MAG: twin transmembrane helix small protein [Pseudomonadota bacterium]